MADQELVNGLSKLIGYGIVLPAFFVLIPQILKVLSYLIFVTGATDGVYGGKFCYVLPIFMLLGF